MKSCFLKQHPSKHFSQRKKGYRFDMLMKKRKKIEKEKKNQTSIEYKKIYIKKHLSWLLTWNFCLCVCPSMNWFSWVSFVGPLRAILCGMEVNQKANEPLLFHCFIFQCSETLHNKTIKWKWRIQYKQKCDSKNRYWYQIYKHWLLNALLLYYYY